MNDLSAIELLNAWEKGQRGSSVERALLLLSAATPDSSGNDPARLAVGRRDGLLLSLREQLFGRQLVGLVDCPSCNQRLEFDFLTSDIAVSNSSNDISEDHLFEVEEYQIIFRLPNSADLMEVSDLDTAAAGPLLLHHCINQVSQNGFHIDLSEVPKSIIEMLTQNMADLDPQANIEIDFFCPDCNHRWSDLFDIATYLWEEVDRWALRTLEEVHVLAASYGWSQNDILNLSAWRRRAYVEMVTNR